MQKPLQIRTINVIVKGAEDNVTIGTLNVIIINLSTVILVMLIYLCILFQLVHQAQLMLEHCIATLLKLTVSIKYICSSNMFWFRLNHHFLKLINLFIYLASVTATVSNWTSQFT
jgi:hypothetical protein